MGETPEAFGTNLPNASVRNYCMVLDSLPS